MKSGESYIVISEEDTPTDPMIVAIKSKGINKATVVYATRYSTDAGWTMVDSDVGGLWLGFTRSEAMKFIERITIVVKYGSRKIKIEE